MSGNRGYWDLSGFAMGGPSQEVIEVGRVIAAATQAPRAIDLGAGVGRNSLFLSGLGFDVTAVEKSPPHIERAKIAQVATGSSYRLVHAHAEEFCPDGLYDLCLLLGILHFLPNAIAHRVAQDLKTATCPGGVHVITVSQMVNPGQYKNTLKAQNHQNSFGRADVEQCFSDWDIVSYERYVKRDNHLGGTVDVHPIEKFVMSKPLRGGGRLIEAERTRLATRPDQALVEAALSADRLESTTISDLRRRFGAEDLKIELETTKPQLALLPSDSPKFCLTIAFWGTSKCYLENGVLIGHASYATPYFHRYRSASSSDLQ